MFTYSEKSIINKDFKIKELLNMIHANNDIKEEAKLIDSVCLTNVLAPRTTNMEANAEVQEIYIFDIKVNQKKVPTLFLTALNKEILLQSLFRIWYKEKVVYFSSLKLVIDDILYVLKTMQTNWQVPSVQEMPITSKLNVVYQSIISYITTIKFRDNESISDYSKRIQEIKKLESEIEKLTKKMNAEKQPNLRMAMNDKIKEMKNDIQNLKK